MDIASVAAIAHEARVPLMIDNTFATPALFRPPSTAATSSCTRRPSGSAATASRSAACWSTPGKFDWDASGKFPTLTEPYAGYHGLDFAEEFGPPPSSCAPRAEGLRDFGACMSPTNAFHILQGVETLPMRMQRHVENARQVVAFLAAAPEVEWVNYPGLPSHPDHALAERLMPLGSGSIVSFGIKGGRAAGRRFIEGLRCSRTSPMSATPSRW
jgi:O-acetylhomoserine (thiol)-lyase